MSIKKKKDDSIPATAEMIEKGGSKVLLKTMEVFGKVAGIAGAGVGTFIGLQSQISDAQWAGAIGAAIITAAVLTSIGRGRE